MKMSMKKYANKIKFHNRLLVKGKFIPTYTKPRHKLGVLSYSDAEYCEIMKCSRLFREATNPVKIFACHQQWKPKNENTKTAQEIVQKT
jgi:hypothetical protein